MEKALYIIMASENAKQVNKKPMENGEKRERDENGRFVEGNSGGPGRPEGSFSLKAILERELQKMPEGENEKTYAEKIIAKMIEDATEKGDDQKLKLIWNYIEGMPKQGVDITSKGESINYNEEQIKTIAERALRNGEPKSEESSD